MNENQILTYLREVLHPGKGEKDIVELGMVDSMKVSGNNVTVTLVFGKHRDPLQEYLIGSAKAALIRNCPEGTEVELKTIVRDAEEKPQKKQNVNDLTLEEVNSVRHIIGIASGKGGVGKSTVAVNLAIALARLGFRVGLADADVYGPSVPIMTATEGQIPDAMEENGKEIILPIEKYGVKWMSIGYFAQPGQALIWRGPMACNALKQMILQVRWGALDYLLIDMPPGTGDIHISLVGDIPMEGAVIVTTPQPVALADVEKGVDMFRNEKINRKIFGLVENMAWFTPEELPDNRYYIFGKDGGLKMAASFGIPVLGQIPLVQSIRECGDAGEPVALSSRPDSLAFIDLARKLVEEVEKN
ncbi:MAG: Mrp/NBP35 family ATP-binding protein [Bacteroidales bacterium]|nr:Mrp/NBP35 family ATP-binding protein [Bacteroidales bacterium]